MGSATHTPALLHHHLLLLLAVAAAVSCTAVPVAAWLPGVPAPLVVRPVLLLGPAPVLVSASVSRAGLVLPLAAAFASSRVPASIAPALSTPLPVPATSAVPVSASVSVPVSVPVPVSFSATLRGAS